MSWRKGLLATALLSSLMALPTRAQAPEPPSSQLEQSFQFMLDGQADSALESLNQFVREHPDDPRGYRARAAFLANILKDPALFEVALADYNQALALAPQQKAVFWLQRGRLLHRLDRHREAILDLDRFIATDSGYPDAYFLRARSQWLLGNGRAALADLDRTLQLSPMLAEAYGLRGIVHLQLGQPSEGVADLDQAVKLDPNSAYRSDLESITRRKVAADGLSWVPYLSPEGDFAAELPMPVRTSLKNDQFMVASALGAGHMYGVIRHPHDDDSRRWKLESEDCRQAVFTFLEVSGGQVVHWQIQSFAGRKCLHASVRGSEGSETDVLVVLAQKSIYLVAAVRPSDSPPFDDSRRRRFFQSFRLLKDL